jgi:hypothetical protein
VLRGGWPPLALLSGPLTGDEVPRVILEERDGVHAGIELGGLADLLERASAA